MTESEHATLMDKVEKTEVRKGSGRVPADDWRPSCGARIRPDSPFFVTPTASRLLSEGYSEGSHRNPGKRRER